MTLSPNRLTLPLFPLNTVLFPAGELRLQVFEVRYLDMVHKCQRNGTPFGIVALQTGQEVRTAQAQPEQLHPVGVIAQITALQAPQPGLLMLECLGQQRFHIERSWMLPHGLWMAEVTLLADDIRLEVPQHLRRCAQMLAQVLMNKQAQDGDTAPPTPQQVNDCGWVANRWAEMLPLSSRTRQQLMALNNPLLRLELIADVLEQSNSPGNASTEHG